MSAYYSSGSYCGQYRQFQPFIGTPVKMHPHPHIFCVVRIYTYDVISVPRGAG